jgi:hypothetical protein
VSSVAGVAYLPASLSPLSRKKVGLRHPPMANFMASILKKWPFVLDDNPHLYWLLNQYKASGTNEGSHL